MGNIRCYKIRFREVYIGGEITVVNIIDVFVCFKFCFFEVEFV